MAGITSATGVLRAITRGGASGATAPASARRRHLQPVRPGLDLVGPPGVLADLGQRMQRALPAEHLPQAVATIPAAGTGVQSVPSARRPGPSSTPSPCSAPSSPGRHAPAGHARPAASGPQPAGRCARRPPTPARPAPADAQQRRRRPASRDADKPRRDGLQVLRRRLHRGLALAAALELGRPQPPRAPRRGGWPPGPPPTPPRTPQARTGPADRRARPPAAAPRPPQPWRGPRRAPGHQRAGGHYLRATSFGPLQATFRALTPGCVATGRAPAIVPRYGTDETRSIRPQV